MRATRPPSADGVGVAQAVEVLEQAQPRRLQDIRRVGLVEAVAAGGGPDEAREAIDERLSPSSPVCGPA
jgi:hypothetical protein